MTHSKLPLIRVHLFGFIFSPSLLPTVGVIIFLPLLISLGIWQLHRATEKKMLEQNFSAQHTLIELADIKNLYDKNLQYHPIQVAGSFDLKHLIFLDNRIYKQRVGYYVFSPFIVNGTKQVLLVNRGFIAKERSVKLPILNTPWDSRIIKGLIYFPGKPFLLKKEPVQTQWPVIVQAINLKETGRILNKPTYPFYLLLEQGDSVNLIKDWHPVSFPSYRHVGYAIQWFLLSLTLLVIYLLLNTTRSKS